MVPEKQKKIIIIGAKGQLGSALCAAEWPDSYQIYPFNHLQLDITNKSAIEEALLSASPDCIINSSVYRLVDNPDVQKAFQTNSLGLLFLSEMCKKYQIPIVHFSTDYVFDGRKRSPYHEDDYKNPLNVYGTSKYAGELTLQNLLPSHIIIRTSWLYGPYGNNFVRWIWDSSQMEKELTIVDDQIGCPTSALDVAQATALIVQQQLGKPLEDNGWGVYHLCGSTPTSWYHFSQFILDEISKFDPIKLKIRPITTHEFREKNPHVACRPLYSVLQCDRIQKNFSISQKCWKENVTNLISYWANS